MLSIRPEQMQVFARQLDRQLHMDIAAFLRQACSEQVSELPDTLLDQRVNEAVSRGRSYGLASTSALETFVALMFQFGPGFDSHPNVERALEASGLSPDDRLDTLVLESPDRVWEEMAVLAAGYAWEDEVGGELTDRA